MRNELWRKQWKLVFHKQLHFFAVDILRKMCEDDCRIKSAFQCKCGRILSGMYLMLRDLQAGVSGWLWTLLDASGRFLVWPLKPGWCLSSQLLHDLTLPRLAPVARLLYRTATKLRLGLGLGLVVGLGWQSDSRATPHFYKFV